MSRGQSKIEEKNININIKKLDKTFFNVYIKIQTWMLNNEQKMLNILTNLIK